MDAMLRQNHRLSRSWVSPNLEEATAHGTLIGAPPRDLGDMWWTVFRTTQPRSMALVTRS